MLTDHTIAVTALVLAAAAFAGLVCGWWMLGGDHDDLDSRVRRLEEREADRIAEERATRRVPAWDDDPASHHEH